MKKICVYTGSNIGNKPEYKDCATQLGQELAKKSIELIYGGSAIGLMGEVARQVLSLGGKAIGVVPKGLFPKDFLNASLSQLIEVKDMHERKMTMFDLADGFIVLPGGIGTLEELFEIFSWAQLGIHKKPLGIVNTNGFYDPLLAMVDNIVDHGFMNPSNTKLLLVDNDPISLLNKMLDYTPPVLGAKWHDLKK